MLPKILSITLLSIVLIGVSSCSSAILQESTDIAKEGTEYADKVANLADTVNDFIIDYDNKKLQEVRPALEGSSPEKIKTTLEQQNKNISNIVNGINSLKESSSLLKTFFTLLDEAAGGTEKYATSMQTETDKLVKSINTLSSRDGGDERIPEGRTAGISSLSNEVAKSLRSNAVRTFLSVTAQPVKRLLADNDRKLKFMRESYLGREKAKLASIKTAVIVGYRDGNVDGEWAQNRKAVLKQDIHHAKLDDVIKGSEKLQESWESLINGKTNVRFFTADLEYFNSTLDAFNTSIN